MTTQSVLPPANHGNSLNRKRKDSPSGEGPSNTSTAPAVAVAAATATRQVTPHKKSKTTTDETDYNAIVEHFNALGDRLPLRAKTNVQLKITDESGKNSCRVVCSGSISLKKVGQLVAYLTGHASDYEYHVQRGKSLKGSYFELALLDNCDKCNDLLDDPDTLLWLGSKATEKDAKAKNVDFALDKPIKLVQVFQGLIVMPSSGMVFDNDDNSRKVSLVWISDKGDRYTVTAEGIVPNKGNGKLLPMPRVVHHDYYNAKKQPHGFAAPKKRTIQKINTVLRGDRKAPAQATYYLLPGETPPLGNTPAQVAAKPICRADGTVDDAMRTFFSKPNVESVGGKSSDWIKNQ